MGSINSEQLPLKDLGLISYEKALLLQEKTRDGIAINIKNDLAIFDQIVPCGLDGVSMTSLFKESGMKIEMTEVKKRLSVIINNTLNPNKNNNLHIFTNKKERKTA